MWRVGRGGQLGLAQHAHRSHGSGLLRWPLAPMAARSPPAGRTGPCCYGIPPPVRNGPRLTGHTDRVLNVRFLPDASAHHDCPRWRCQMLASRCGIGPVQPPAIGG